MAFYKYPRNLTQLDSDAFDSLRGPGQEVPFSGIYRCINCGKEIAANQGDPLPPQNHHQHSALSGPVRWQLIVWTKY